MAARALLKLCSSAVIMTAYVGDLVAIPQWGEGTASFFIPTIFINDPCMLLTRRSVPICMDPVMFTCFTNRCT